MTLEDKLSVLARLAAAFRREGISWAVGASMMLYFRGVVADFHDIDLMVAEEGALRARAALERLGTRLPPKPNEGYCSAHFYEFLVDGVEVDLISGFAVVHRGVVYPCPMTADTVDGSVSLSGETVPLQSLESWRRYYELMGREEKLALIDEALRCPRP